MNKLGLQDRERPPSLVGFHGSQANTASFDRRKWLGIVRSIHPGWGKIVDTESAGQKEWARMLRQAGIMPIIRPSIPTCTPTPDAIRAYIDEGITKWLEFWNEPNIDEGWSDRVDFVGVGALVECWLVEAERIISWGGYPAFPSMAECGLHPDCSSIEWYKRLFAYMGKHHRDRARMVFQSGAWLAVHDATLNRFWKEDGEYHFEHPYSKNVREHIGWAPTLWDDDLSLIGHQIPVFLMKQHLGSDIEVPVISTEGGIFGGLIGEIPDGAYPAFDETEHARATVAMFRWLERYQKTYPWYFGMCPWKFAPFGHYPDAWPGDNWIKKNIKKRLAVVEAVANMGPPDPNAQPIGPIGLFKGEEEMVIPDWLTDVRETLRRHETKRYPRRSLDKIDTIVVHHTATFKNTPEQIADYHVLHKDWAGAGYHVYVRKNGKAYLMNDLEAISIHAYGHHTHTIGLSFEGDFTRESAGEHQIERGKEAVAWLRTILGEVPVLAHKAMPGSSTACPGRFPVAALVGEEPEEEDEIAELLAKIAELEALRQRDKANREADRAAMVAARNTLNARLDGG